MGLWMYSRTLKAQLARKKIILSLYYEAHGVKRSQRKPSGMPNTTNGSIVSLASTGIADLESDSESMSGKSQTSGGGGSQFSVGSIHHLYYIRFMSSGWGVTALTISFIITPKTRFILTSPLNNA